jgi:hypothetical protein
MKKILISFTGDSAPLRHRWGLVDRTVREMYPEHGSSSNYSWLFKGVWPTYSPVSCRATNSILFVNRVAPILRLWSGRF